MQSSLEKLRKLFRLEHGNGYANTAVIGGLANILDFWEGEARNEHIPEPLVQAVAATLRLYADQAPAERIESLKSLWKQVQETYPKAVPARKPASTRPAAPEAPPAPVAAPDQGTPPRPPPPSGETPAQAGN